MTKDIEHVFDKHIKNIERERKVSNMDINDLYKRTSLDNLNKQFEKFKPSSYADERFWKPDVDKSGNGVFIIRFLPAPAIDGIEAVTTVHLYTHAFKGPTQQWYIENSLTTLKQKDPCGEYNSKLWAAGEYSKTSPERKQASEQKRKAKYISNILVVSDPKHPENDGKMFLFSYGQKIFDKIQGAMHPEFDSDVPLNPFCPRTGANFRIKIKNVKGADGKNYRSYDESHFEQPSMLYGGDDDQIVELWKREYSLAELIDPAKAFKSYAELKTRLDAVMGFDTASYDGSPAGARQQPAAAPARRKPVIVEDDEETTFTDDSDPDLQHFRDLAN